LKSILSIAFIATLILFTASSALAQTHRGSVRGTVYDPNKAVVAGATITITEVETGETRTATSEEQGGYSISSLRPGHYRLNVTASGFTAYPNEFKLSVNQDARLDIDLDVAGVNTGPQVIFAGPEDLKKDSASQGTVIENRQVEGLPLDGRNFSSWLCWFLARYRRRRARPVPSAVTLRSA